MRAFAVILAAGRGSRMQNLTAEKPKCLVELAGKSLLRWQETALQAAGLENIHIVRGYRGERLPDRFSFSVNPRWAETNMLYSLACAAPYIEERFKEGYGQFVISYSDIVYHPDHLRKLLAADADIAISYDTLWEQLWKLRFANVLDDAETFREENGCLREIGGKTLDMGDIGGQYMGLLKLSRTGWNIWQNNAAKTDVAKMDMTSFLRVLLAQKEQVRAVPVAGKWCEADSESDLLRYEEAMTNGSFSHDWREK